MIDIGVVGYGYWGPNIVRNFNINERSQVTFVCDSNEKSLHRVKRVYSNINTTTQYEDMISSSYVDAIAVITPVFTHYDFAKKALQAGKHVFVEKPFTATSSQGEELINIAEKQNLTIMVDHTFLFTGAVKKIKELVDNNILGEILYYDSTRARSCASACVRCAPPR